MLAEIPTLMAQQTAGSTPLVDWWTLIAQVVNFLILVLLLRHFLYRRILDAMDRREKKIASHFEAAELKEQDAAAQAEALQRQNDEFEQQRDSMLTEARQQADEQRRELTGKAREQVQAQADRWREDLQRGKEAFVREMRDIAGRQVCAIARRALADLADAELERAMVGVLIRRLVELSAEHRRELTDAMANDGEDLVIVTAWELPESDRAIAVQAVRKHLAGDAEIRFETAPELTCGIELRAGGRKVSWTIESYIEGIREQLAETVDRTVAAESQRAEAEKTAADAEDGAEQESSNG